MQWMTIHMLMFFLQERKGCALHISISFVRYSFYSPLANNPFLHPTSHLTSLFFAKTSVVLLIPKTAAERAAERNSNFFVKRKHHSNAYHYREAEKNAWPDHCSPRLKPT